MIKRMILIMLMCMFVLPAVVFAGEYKLLKRMPTGVHDHTVEVTDEVCKAYEKNLNSFKDMPQPMVCERKINPQFTDFKKPQWKELDLWENREIAMKFHRHIWRKGFDEKRWLTRFKQNIAENRLEMSETWVDIDNDGTIDHVISYGLKCDPSDESFFQDGGKRVLVWNDSRNEPDQQRSSQLLSRNHDIYVHRKTTYIDWFTGGVGFTGGKLYVFRLTPHGDSGAVVCIYNYAHSTKGGK